MFTQATKFEMEADKGFDKVVKEMGLKVAAQQLSTMDEILVL
jgi:hypothetical protein